MQLKKIKFAGFKSFADPTELHFNSQLVGIVGPNGCGKSNVIDAVRWVMGESSAKNLRGSSMADVIFNGSSGRKPINQAAIDLFFDNSIGTLGGQYAAYAEIHIRREVTRDGQSHYYFNGTRCRKRDIVDVFLGTGLGPRSYSIIEQGMISRVIEAKPEDLRAFLEEAAGISVYKKRKHDTQLRINHTRENLERLADVRQELEKQIEKLKRQSESAKKFQEFKDEKETLELELLALRWNNFDSDLSTKSEKVQQLSTKLEERLARRASIDAQLEKIRVDNSEKTEALNKVQANFYELGAEIARREQTLEHHKERRQQLEQDLAEVKQNIDISQIQLTADDEEANQLRTELATVNAEYTTAKATLETLEAHLADSELNMHNWREQWEAWQVAAHKSQEQAEVEKARIEELEKKTHDAQIRIERVAKEQTGLELSALSSKAQSLTEKLTVKEDEIKQCKSGLDEVAEKITHNREELKHKQRQANEVIGELQAAKGRQASLEALQQAALGKDDKNLTAWLGEHELTTKPRLAELLQVTEGWEHAIETVLGNYLEAICTADLQSLKAELADKLPEIEVTLLEQKALTNATTLTASNAELAEQPLLVTKVNTELAINSLLQGIYAVANLDTAFELRDKLATNESIITSAGVWLGPNWIKIHAGKSEKSGVLQREQELKSIAGKIIELNASKDGLAMETDALEKNNLALEEDQAGKRKEHSSLQHILREISNEVSAVKTRYEYMQRRSEQLQKENEELQHQLTVSQEEINSSRTVLAQAIEEMAKYSSRKAELTAEKEQVESKLHKVKEEVREQRTLTHELEVKRKTLDTKSEAITASLARLHKHLADLCAKRDELNKLLNTDDTPVGRIKQELDELLEQQLTAEQELNTARVAVEEIDQQIRALEKERNEVEAQAQNVRTELEEFKMAWQTIEVRKQTIEEEFVERGTIAAAAVASLSAEAEEGLWHEKIEKLTNKIERLGPINLAAITEYESETERKKYLDAQFEDLSDALNTLENAIKSIDKETRSKFKETFDAVNENFKKLFPKLFGGGKANLELVGEDLLDAGVGVIAQPPGKKNSSIHLLSGGEKALTAVSLVFGIFQLNPAPFCMLDEVDAPLDDANVSRFCDLIVEMSEAVQFVIITHNKLTMEISKQLAGVTMKEPGVSRLVSVDIDEAVAMGVQ